MCECGSRHVENADVAEAAVREAIHEHGGATPDVDDRLLRAAAERVEHCRRHGGLVLIPAHLGWRSPAVDLVPVPGHLGCSGLHHPQTTMPRLPPALPSPPTVRRHLPMLGQPCPTSREGLGMPRTYNRGRCRAAPRMPWPSFTSTSWSAPPARSTSGAPRPSPGPVRRPPGSWRWGRGPGETEDRLGKPFVGAAGNVLTRLLESIGLRREDIYITNVVKCRPPGNRDPEPAEMEACSAFLDAQIEIIRPDVILILGRHALARLLPGSRAASPASTAAGWSAATASTSPCTTPPPPSTRGR